MSDRENSSDTAAEPLPPATCEVCGSSTSGRVMLLCRHYGPDHLVGCHTYCQPGPFVKGSQDEDFLCLACTDYCRSLTAAVDKLREAGRAAALRKRGKEDDAGELPELKPLQGPGPRVRHASEIVPHFTEQQRINAAAAAAAAGGGLQTKRRRLDSSALDEAIEVGRAARRTAPTRGQAAEAARKRLEAGASTHRKATTAAAAGTAALEAAVAASGRKKRAAATATAKFTKSLNAGDKAGVLAAKAKQQQARAAAAAAAAAAAGQGWEGPSAAGIEVEDDYMADPYADDGALNEQAAAGQQGSDDELDEQAAEHQHAGACTGLAVDRQAYNVQHLDARLNCQLVVLQEPPAGGGPHPPPDEAIDYLYVTGRFWRDTKAEEAAGAGQAAAYAELLKDMESVHDDPIEAGSGVPMIAGGAFELAAHPTLRRYVTDTSLTYRPMVFDPQDIQGRLMIKDLLCEKQRFVVLSVNSKLLVMLPTSRHCLVAVCPVDAGNADELTSEVVATIMGHPKLGCPSQAADGSNQPQSPSESLQSPGPDSDADEPDTSSPAEQQQEEQGPAQQGAAEGAAGQQHQQQQQQQQEEEEEEEDAGEAVQQGDHPAGNAAEQQQQQQQQQQQDEPGMGQDELQEQQSQVAEASVNLGPNTVQKQAQEQGAEEVQQQQEVQEGEHTGQQGLAGLDKEQQHMEQQQQQQQPTQVRELPLGMRCSQQAPQQHPESIPTEFVQALQGEAVPSEAMQAEVVLVKTVQAKAMRAQAVQVEAAQAATVQAAAVPGPAEPLLLPQQPPHQPQQQRSTDAIKQAAISPVLSAAPHQVQRFAAGDGKQPQVAPSKAPLAAAAAAPSAAAVNGSTRPMSSGQPLSPGHHRGVRDLMLLPPAQDTTLAQLIRWLQLEDSSTRSLAACGQHQQQQALPLLTRLMPQVTDLAAINRLRLYLVGFSDDHLQRNLRAPLSAARSMVQHITSGPHALPQLCRDLRLPHPGLCGMDSTTPRRSKSRPAASAPVGIRTAADASAGDVVDPTAVDVTAVDPTADTPQGCCHVLLLPEDMSSNRLQVLLGKVPLWQLLASPVVISAQGPGGGLLHLLLLQQQQQQPHQKQQESSAEPAVTGALQGTAAQRLPSWLMAQQLYSHRLAVVADQQVLQQASIKDMLQLLRTLREVAEAQQGRLPSTGERELPPSISVQLLVWRDQLDALPVDKRLLVDAGRDNDLVALLDDKLPVSVLSAAHRQSAAAAAACLAAHDQRRLRHIVALQPEPDSTTPRQPDEPARLGAGTDTGPHTAADTGPAQQQQPQVVPAQAAAVALSKAVGPARSGSPAASRSKGSGSRLRQPLACKGKAASCGAAAVVHSDAAAAPRRATGLGGDSAAAAGAGSAEQAPECLQLQPQPSAVLSGTLQQLLQLLRAALPSSGDNSTRGPISSKASAADVKMEPVFGTVELSD